MNHTDKKLRQNARSATRSIALAASVLLLATGASATHAVTITGHAWEDTDNNGQRDVGEPGESEEIIAYLCQPPWGIVGNTTSEEDGAFSFELDPAWYQFGAPGEDEFTHLFVGDPNTDNDFWPNGFTSCYDYSQPQPDLGLGIAETDDEGEISVAEVFFELNNTDGDLGMQAEIDEDGWVTLELTAPNEQQVLYTEVSGSLAEQGMTELFFESAEPGFDELSPEEFFARFAPGTYEVELESADGDEFEAEVEVSHIMPAPVGDVRVAGLTAAANCDDDLPIVDAGDIEIRWNPVTTSHPDLGASGPVTIDNYEFVIEIEDEEADRTHSMSVTLPAQINSFVVPGSLVELAPEGEVKFEIGAQATGTNNRTVVESCFEVQ